VNNNTLLLALAGIAVGTGAAMLLMPRTRNAISSEARHALDYAGDYLPALAGQRRKPARRTAAKRSTAKRSRKTSRAA